MHHAMNIFVVDHLVCFGSYLVQSHQRKLLVPSMAKQPSGLEPLCLPSCRFEGLCAVFVLGGYHQQWGARVQADIWVDSGNGESNLLKLSSKPLGLTLATVGNHSKVLAPDLRPGLFRRCRRSCKEYDGRKQVEWKILLEEMGL